MLRITAIQFAFLVIDLFSTSILQANSPISVQFLNNSDWNFIENKGQVPGSEIKYYGQQAGANLYCKAGMISFIFTKKYKETTQISESTSLATILNNHSFSKLEAGFSLDGEIRRKSKYHEADLTLLYSNLDAPIVASDRQEYYENYYSTNSLDSSINKVRTYKTITYRNIYPQIDMVLHAKEGGMKYEFVVYPGGNVNDIKIQWSGLDNIDVKNDGGISYVFASSRIEESKPVSFQEKKIVETDFVKHSNVIGFKLNKYDKTKILLIDPTLVWSTYFGGSGLDYSNAITTDDSGNVYITGYTASRSGIVTKNAYQTYFVNDSDADDFCGFISKFNSKGEKIWATYYGGNDWTIPNGICADGSCNVYITGTTTSTTGIATSGAFKTKPNSRTFLAKFNSSGLRQWGTYYGGYSTSSGSAVDDSLAIGDAVAADDSNNVYLTGTIAWFIGFAKKDSAAFIAKFDKYGNFQWKREFGTRIAFSGNAVATDGIGNVFITGTTTETSNIATAGAYQTSYGGGFRVPPQSRVGNLFGGFQSGGGGDAFLAKFNSTGKLQWSTYFGGSGNENSSGIATDRFGNVYISGNTGSYSGIATNGAYQFTSQGDDAYLAKFNENGDIIWATYYGGDFYTEGYSVATDGSGNIYMVGATTCPSGIATSDAYQSHIKGGESSFLVQFNNAGVRQWASYFGGNSNDGAFGVATDQFGNIYITGQTSDTSDMATSGASQTYFGGGTGDAYLTKFYNKLVVNDAGIDSIIGPKGSYCKNGLPVTIKLKNYGHNEIDSVKIILSVNRKIYPVYQWIGKLKPDSSVNLNIGTIVFPSDTDTLKIWTYNPNGGLDSFPGNDTAKTVINSYPLPNANAGPDTTLCYDESYTMQGSGGVTYFWRPATYLSSSTNPNAQAVLPNTENYVLLVTNAYGCKDSSSVLLKVRPKLHVKIASDAQVCYGSILHMYAIVRGGDSLHYHFSWPYDYGYTGDSIIKITSASGWHKVILSDNCSAATATDSFYVKVVPPAKAAFNWSPDSPLVREPVTFHNQSTNASSYLWEFGNKDMSSQNSPINDYSNVGKYKVMLVANGLNNCPNDTSYETIYVINLLVTIYIPNVFSPNGDGINDVFDISGVGIKSYSYNIYNRWGEHIFEATQGAIGWNGIFKGTDAPGGIYLYTLDVIDVGGIHHYLSGNVTLMR